MCYSHKVNLKHNALFVVTLLNDVQELKLATVEEVLDVLRAASDYLPVEPLLAISESSA
jgi:hypothetical protein